jgi:hypothetical protein
VTPAHAAVTPLSPRQARFIALPVPLLRELYPLGSDCALVAIRLIERAAYTPTEVDGIRIDIGECLVSQRSAKLWGDLEFGHKLRPDARRSVVRRALEHLEKAGIIQVRPAQPPGPSSCPSAKRERGPTPSIARVLKYRGIIWLEAAEMALGRDPAPAQSSAPVAGPILPIGLPTQPEASACAGPASAEARQAAPEVPAPARVSAAELAASFPGVRPFQKELAAHFGSRRLKVSLDAEKWAELDEELRRVGHDNAVVACVVRGSRRSADLNAIGSLWWFLPHLRELPDAAQALASEEAAAATGAPTAAEGSMAGPGCAIWKLMLGEIKRGIRPDIVARWLAPLNGSVQEDKLLLVAPDQFHRNFVEDNYRNLLEELLTRANAQVDPPDQASRLWIVVPATTAPDARGWNE